MSGALSALPQVPESALPRAIREGGAAARQTYEAALGFEKLFVEQLLKTASARGPLAEGPHASAVQSSLADAMVASGGFGLAAQLHSQLESAAS